MSSKEYEVGRAMRGRAVTADVVVPPDKMPGCPLCGHAIEEGMEIVIGRSKALDRTATQLALVHEDCAKDSE